MQPGDNVSHSQFSHWHFLNTRPSIRANALTDALVAQGIAVRQMPLLDLIPCNLSENEKQYLQRVSGYDLVVCISPMAAELGMVACQQYDIDCLKQPIWVAVGNSTADILSSTDITAMLPTESSNEGMLAMPAIQALNSESSVLIWRGQGGRRLLYDALIERGVKVDSIAFYQRKAPGNLATQFQTHKDWANMVLISSGEAWRHWCSVCNDIYAYDYLVLGQRIYQRVLGDMQQAGLDAEIIQQKVRFLADLNPQSILNMLSS